MVSRWYRAPEIILGQDYTSAIDIWAAGCVFAELIGRTVLFRGSTTLEQLERIIAVMGTPTSEAMPNEIHEFNRCTRLSALPPREKIAWSTLFSKASPLALDLLDNMLVYNSRARFSAKQCLEHPYFGSSSTSVEVEDIKKNLDWLF